jgi:hypothetical protein
MKERRRTCHRTGSCCAYLSDTAYPTACQLRSDTDKEKGTGQMGSGRCGAHRARTQKPTLDVMISPSRTLGVGFLRTCESDTNFPCRSSAEVYSDLQGDVAMFNSLVAHLGSAVLQLWSIQSHWGSPPELIRRFPVPSTDSNDEQLDVCFNTPA